MSETSIQKNSFSIRNAVLDDASQISALYKVVWDEQKGKLPDLLRLDRQPNQNKMREWLSNEHFFVAELKNHVIGVAGCYMEHGVCKMVHMVVDKDHRNKGVGTMLVSKVEEFARKNNANKIMLDTSSRLEASIAFYKKKGFRMVGELKKHFWGEDIILFEKLL